MNALTLAVFRVRPFAYSWVLAVAILAFVLGQPSNAASAPPITEAEAHATEVVAAFLGRGPVAVYERLANRSPHKALGEIEARLGPNHGAHWELRTASEDFSSHGAVFRVTYPSGFEDIVTFEMVREGTGWKIDTIRTSAEVDPITRKAQSRSQPTPRAGPEQTATGLLPMFTFAIPVLAISAAISTRRFPRLAWTFGASAIMGLSLAALTIALPSWPGLLHRKSTYSVRPVSVVPVLSLGSLADYRRALAEGAALPPVRGNDPEVAEVARLWSAAMKDPADASQVLTSLRFASKTPLAQLITARIAVREGRYAEAAQAFANMQPPTLKHDGFALEELETAEDHRSQIYEETRTRDPWFFYGSFLLADGPLRGRAFLEGWRIAPIPREEVLLTYAPVLEGLGVGVIDLASPEEPRIVDATLGKRPIAVPPGTRSSVLGRSLMLDIGDGRLFVPAGSELAPGATKIVTAVEFDRAEEPAAVTSGETGFTDVDSPATHRQVIHIVKALAKKRRWADVLQLTEPFASGASGSLAPLLTWRVAALVRTGRTDEARRLALSSSMHRALDSASPQLSFEVAELLALAGAWGDAAEMARLAGKRPGAPDVSHSLKAWTLRQELAVSGIALRTSHFEIHMTSNVPAEASNRIGELLELELERLRGKISVSQLRVIRVNVIDWNDFSRRITGSAHVLGIYDGEITIPFAEVTAYRREVLSILTHELTHALVAQASHDAAPRWFQEGFATRMELLERQENVFDIRDGGSLLALDLLDAALGTPFDAAQARSAYVHADTFIRFLESRYGRNVSERLIASFASGATSDEALQSVTGRNTVALDRDFRSWGAAHRGPFIDTAPWPYQEYGGLPIDGQGTISWSRRQKKP